MAPGEKSGRLIGQILLDAGFISNGDLTLALAEQQHSNELLGQILVRMGVVEAAELKAALSAQENIRDLQAAIRSAAGTRQLLGSLLVTAGHISNKQLEKAIAVQKETGSKLGEVFIRLGILTADQLDCLLQFQQNQDTGKCSAHPLRLGELLITTGQITRQQLDIALAKQGSTRAKLGEVLIAEGYVAPRQINYAINLQQRFMTAALAAILTFSGLSLAGCGSGAGSASQAPLTPTFNLTQVVKTNYLAVTSEDYGLVQPTFYYSTFNEAFWSIQANVAKSLYDIDSKTVLRIDIPKASNGWPLINKTFSIEDNPQFDKFPGSFLVLNGKQSAGNKVESGIIVFSADSIVSQYVSGSFDVVMTDYDSGISPPPKHKIKGIFSFKMGEYGPAGV